MTETTLTDARTRRIFSDHHLTNSEHSCQVIFQLFHFRSEQRTEPDFPDQSAASTTNLIGSTSPDFSFRVVSLASHGSVLVRKGLKDVLVKVDIAEFLPFRIGHQKISHNIDTGVGAFRILQEFDQV